MSAERKLWCSMTIISNRFKVFETAEEACLAFPVGSLVMLCEVNLLGPKLRRIDNIIYEDLKHWVLHNWDHDYADAILTSDYFTVMSYPKNGLSPVAFYIEVINRNGISLIFEPHEIQLCARRRAGF